MLVIKWLDRINDGRRGCKGGRIDATFMMQRISGFFLCWAKCKWCHLLLQWEAKLLGCRGFPERFVLKWLQHYFFPYLFSWKKISGLYYRREKYIMLRETKPWLPSCYWIIAVPFQCWLKSKTWYRSLNEMLANIFLLRWKCNLSIEQSVPVNFSCNSILHLNQRGQCLIAAHVLLALLTLGVKLIPEGVESTVEGHYM